MNKFHIKIFIYRLFLISHPLLLYLIIMISYTLIFIYFFTDPILCQDINSSGVAGTNDTMLSYATQSTQETQQTVVDPEIGERLKELKAISLSNPHQINERLNALNTLYVNDLVKVND